MDLFRSFRIVARFIKQVEAATCVSKSGRKGRALRPCDYDGLREGARRWVFFIDIDSHLL